MGLLLATCYSQIRFSAQSMSIQVKYIKKKKLHFITLNYISNYTLHHKLFECMFCTLNYNSCYTLHPAIKFAVNVDENSKFRMQSVIRSIV